MVALLGGVRSMAAFRRGRGRQRGGRALAEGFGGIGWSCGSSRWFWDSWGSVPGERVWMAKAEFAETFEAAEVGELRIEDAPEWRKMQARRQRIEADLREAEEELRAAREEWMGVSAEIGRSELQRYLSGEITARELGNANLDGLQERMRRARERVSFVQAAEGEHRKEEEQLRRRLTLRAAEAVFPEYAEAERRILRATAELLDAVQDRRAIEDGLHARGFCHVGHCLHRMLVDALGIEEPTEAALASSRLNPGFLTPFANSDISIRHYLSFASRALGEELPGAH